MVKVHLDGDETLSPNKDYPMRTEQVSSVRSSTYRRLTIAIDRGARTAAELDFERFRWPGLTKSGFPHLCSVSAFEILCGGRQARIDPSHGYGRVPELLDKGGVMGHLGSRGRPRSSFDCPKSHRPIVTVRCDRACGRQ